MSEHTRLPWRVGSSRLDGSVNLVEADDGLVAFCDFELGHDAVNAAFIVMAVNAHEELVAALAECATRFEKALIHSGTDPEFAAEAVKQYRALANSENTP